ncbi:MAG: SGNH/GDSL hydrolase family protein [Actinomycetota bacterium]
MVRKVLTWTGIVLGSFALLLGVEVYLAYTREYLPTSPAIEIGGTFGPRDGRPLTFVVLGDSTAAGLGAGSAEHAYATVLSERLGRRGWKVDLLAHGESGARVKDVLVEQTPIAERAEADLVFVGIGANDATHLTSLDSIKEDMSATLDRLLGTGATVVVAGPPDMRAHAWLEPLRSIVGWRGRQVAAAIEDVAVERGVPVVPLAELAGPYFASHPEDAYASDDFHPGPGGYRAWADAIFPVLLDALQNR